MKLPKNTAAYCLICGERVTEGQDFIASKQRGGSTVYMHTECFNKEQAEMKEARHGCS